MWVLCDLCIHPEQYNSHYNRCHPEDEWKSRAINLPEEEFIDIEDNIQTKGSISARAAELEIITEKMRHDENERKNRMKEEELSLKCQSYEMEIKCNCKFADSLYGCV